MTHPDQPAANPETIRQWHRLFGMILTDVFAETPWHVEMEKEQALRSQLLDVLIIARSKDGPPTPATDTDLPDGLETLRPHNLLTYKSQHEALTDWAVNELVGHYVNYRKLASPKSRLLPDEEFGLYAISTRMPQKLPHQVTFRETARPGVFDMAWATLHIRLIVLSEIERHPRNAVWDLFSAQERPVQQGFRHFRERHPGVEALLRRLLLNYIVEWRTMPYTMDDFIREVRDEFIPNLTTDQMKQFARLLPPDVRLEGLAPEERLKGLGDEELRRLKDLLAKRT